MMWHLGQELIWVNLYNLVVYRRYTNTENSPEIKLLIKDLEQ